MTTAGGPVVFLGSSAFAVDTLEALVEAGERVPLVVTQPDRPSGRGKRLAPTPVKELADRLQLPVFQPENVNDPSALDALAALEPEFLVVVAFGQILRRPALELAWRGAVNLHASLLPRHRGPAPIAGAILAGDAEVGNSTMFMDEGLDTGPVLLQERFPLKPEETRGDLEGRLASSGAGLVLRTLQGLRKGTVQPRAQDPSAATTTQLFRRKSRTIDWKEPAGKILRQVHALSPRPGCAVRVEGSLVRLLRVRESDQPLSPGIATVVPGGTPVAGCGRGSLVLVEVQPEGKRPMTGEEWIRGGGLRGTQELQDPWDG